MKKEEITTLTCQKKKKNEKTKTDARSKQKYQTCNKKMVTLALFFTDFYQKKYKATATNMNFYCYSEEIIEVSISLC